MVHGVVGSLLHMGLEDRTAGSGTPPHLSIRPFHSLPIPPKAHGILAGILLLMSQAGQTLHLLLPTMCLLMVQTSCPVCPAWCVALGHLRHGFATSFCLPSTSACLSWVLYLMLPDLADHTLPTSGHLPFLLLTSFYANICCNYLLYFCAAAVNTTRDRFIYRVHHLVVSPYSNSPSNILPITFSWATSAIL